MRATKRNSGTKREKKTPPSLKTFTLTHLDVFTLFVFFVFFYRFWCVCVCAVCFILISFYLNWNRILSTELLLYPSELLLLLPTGRSLSHLTRYIFNVMSNIFFRSYCINVVIKSLSFYYIFLYTLFK